MELFFNFLFRLFIVSAQKYILAQRFLYSGILWNLFCEICFMEFIIWNLSQLYSVASLGFSKTTGSIIPVWLFLPTSCQCPLQASVCCAAGRSVTAASACRTDPCTACVFPCLVKVLHLCLTPAVTRLSLDGKQGTSFS